ncbi:unnamed protein product [Hapterophycus canaliculatus]
MELEPPVKASSDLLFDVDPRDPAVIVAFIVGFVFIAATLWCSRRRRRGHPNGGVGGVGGGAGTVFPEDSAPTERPRSPVASRYNTRRRRVTTTPGSGSSSKSRASPGKVVILTPRQVALCEVLYDIYRGTVPSRGIESTAVQECGLSTAEIKRQFKKIKQAREGIAGSASPSDSRGGGRAPSPAATRASPSRSSIHRTDGATKNILKSGETLKSRIPPPRKRTVVPVTRASITSPKKPPPSPRRAPAKRGAASRPTPSSPKSGGGSGKRAAKRAASSSPSAKGKATASVLPSPSQSPSSPESPMQTRGKNRSPSVRIGSPKAVPTKRAAPAAGASLSSSPRRGGGGTPSKRGKPASVLEIARREAQEQAAKVASTRANSLRAKS